MNQLANYTVAAVKTIRGHDGQGYQCNLMKNGKKIAEVLDDGWGGGLQIHWMDKTSAVVTNRTYDDKENTYKGTQEEALFNAEVLKLPKLQADPARGMPEMHTSVDIVIDDMVNDALAFKKIAADIKKNFTIKCLDGKMLTWKIKPNQTAEILKAHVQKKYAGATIVNDLPIPEIFQIYKEESLVA